MSHRGASAPHPKHTHTHKHAPTHRETCIIFVRMGYDKRGATHSQHNGATGTPFELTRDSLKTVKDLLRGACHVSPFSSCTLRGPSHLFFLALLCNEK